MFAYSEIKFCFLIANTFYTSLNYLFLFFDHLFLFIIVFMFYYDLLY